MGQILIKLMIIMQSIIIISFMNSFNFVYYYVFARVNKLPVLIHIKADDHQSISIQLIY